MVGCPGSSARVGKRGEPGDRVEEKIQVNSPFNDGPQCATVSPSKNPGSASTSSPASRPLSAGAAEFPGDGKVEVEQVPPAQQGLQPAPLGEAPAGLTALAERCLRADGARPSPADLATLQSRWTGSSVLAAFIERAFDGTLLAAGYLRRARDELRFLGLVDPSARGRGIGSALLDLGLAAAQRTIDADAPLAVVVECEALSEAADELFVSRGLRQFSAEDIMGCDPAAAERPELIDGMELREWDDGTAERFHAVYCAAFREDPGFAEETVHEWIEDYAGNPDFRPRLSLLLSLHGIGDAGFITVSDGWIGEVGVIPEARRRGVAGILLREALARMAATGTRHVALGVDVSNPGAAAVYRQVGFVSEGRWARYRLGERTGP